MKQTIEYYYDLNINELFIEKDTYHFTLNGEDYYFVPFLKNENDLKDIINCSAELKAKGIPCHDILLNIKKEPLTTIDDAKYVLLKVKDKDIEYSIIDIIDYNKKLRLSNIKNNLYRNNWSLLWSKKIDYIEEQLNEITKSNIISLSIDYYIGLAENAIYYMNIINDKYQDKNNVQLTLAHKRVYYPNTKLNYLNPLSFVFDYEIRDVAEYVKSAFWGGGDAILELTTYLKSVKLDNYLYNALFARLIYPSYYFDEYEKIVNQNNDDEVLIKFIKNANKYETFLKEAYTLISKYAPLEKIGWLIY